LKLAQNRNVVPSVSVSAPSSSRPETTGAVTRGAVRLLAALGYAPVLEAPLPNGRRADVMALGPKGDILIVEVKSSLDDYRAYSNAPVHLAIREDFTAQTARVAFLDVQIAG